MLQGTLDLERNESWINLEAREAARLQFEAQARELHAEIVELVRQERQGRYELCVRLGRMHDDALWKHVSKCSTFVGYAVKFGAARSPTEARQLVTLAHQLPKLRILGPLFERGEADWTKIRVAARAAIAKPEDEPRWAKEVLVSSYSVCKSKAQIALGEAPTKDVTFSLPLDLDAHAEHVRGVASQRLGLKLTRAELLELLLDAALDAGFLDDLGPASQAAAEVEDATGPGPAAPADEPEEGDAVDTDLDRAEAEESPAKPGGAASSTRRDVPARIAVPTTCFIVHHCARCEEVEVDGPDGPVPLRPERAAQLAVDAWLLESDGTLSRTIPVRIRRRVFARDRGRCQAPGCGSRQGLHFHHTGGWKRTGHDEDQLTLLCRACHVHLHHGWLSIHGKHSTGFRFFDGGGKEITASKVSTWRPSGPAVAPGAATDPTIVRPAVEPRARVCDEPETETHPAEVLRVARAALRKTQLKETEVDKLLAGLLPDLPATATPSEIVQAAFRALPSPGRGR
jgi:hypothetical protein